ncbi:hypothetical protein M9H77_30638 [Catharanthus roseus]|uniref:Uncharacterized protein n=1 Tax=Catharanthus roseus TaxID=4058 RepID=A0ACB9ZYR1_CATRO|nr:hypothetical protein M9H77_30638 [Catharanthus roseus]
MIVVLDKSEEVNFYANRTNTFFARESLCVQNFEDSSKEEDGKLAYKSIKTIDFFPSNSYLSYEIYFKEIKLFSLEFLLQDFENRMGVNIELFKVEKSNLRKEAFEQVFKLVPIWCKQSKIGLFQRVPLKRNASMVMFVLGRKTNMNLIKYIHSKNHDIVNANNKKDYSREQLGVENWLSNCRKDPTVDEVPQSKEVLGKDLDPILQSKRIYIIRMDLIIPIVFPASIKRFLDGHMPTQSHQEGTSEPSMRLVNETLQSIKQSIEGLAR